MLFGMGQSFYQFFMYFTDVPFNVWGCLLPAVAPVLVLATKPENNWKWRVGRLVLAIGITYVLWNLTINTHHHLERIEYDACQAQFSDGDWQMHEECGNPFIGNGAQTAFALLLGWIPASAYVGFWELLWRRKYRHKIKEIGAAYKKSWVSTALIISSVPMWIYGIFLLGAVIFMLAVCPEGRVSSDKCWF